MASQLTLNREWLLQDVRRRFGLSGRSDKFPLTIGAELELIPRYVDTRLPVPVELPTSGCSVEIIRRAGHKCGWVEKPNGSDPPSWQLDTGARISFEPGGQIEISSATKTSASALIAELMEISSTLSDTFERHGVLLETKGVDPHNPVTRIPLQLHRERYESMTRYFESVGPSGIRMMRQTASIQINIEPGDDPFATWSLLNRMAPVLVAIFANSREYACEDSGHASYRAHLWRTLDPSRTGLFTALSPVERYCDFALAAGWMFARAEDGTYGSFADALNRGANRDDWERHHSTLFPEVRPRGYFEVRSPDMIDLQWIAAPIAMVAGACYHQSTSIAIAELLSHFDDDTLVRAGTLGLADPEMASVAADFAKLTLDGCRALGTEYISMDDLDILEQFVDRYPANGRSPSDDR